MKLLIASCWLSSFIVVSFSPVPTHSQHQPSFQQNVMPAGLMAGVQDCPTNILFSIVATCTSIQSQLPVLVERLRDAIRIQEDPNDFSPSDLAKMRETSSGLCDMADPMLSCLGLLGKCPSLLGSLGSGVEDARGVLQVMCVNKSLDRYLDCTERNGGMNIRQRYCSQYRNYTMLEGTAAQSDTLKSTISSLASFQSFGSMLGDNRGGHGLNDREASAMSGIAGLMGQNGGPKSTINCPLFTLFSGCMASAVKKVCGKEESDSMYYVSQIQAKTGSDTCQLPPTPDAAEAFYLESLYKMQATSAKPTIGVALTTSANTPRPPRVKPSRRIPTTTTTQYPARVEVPDDDQPLWPGQDVTSLWMPNRIRQQMSTTSKRPSVQVQDNHGGNKVNNRWNNVPVTQAPSFSNNNNNQGKNVIVLQLATTPSVDEESLDNAKISSELRQNAFDWSDDEDATYGSRRGANSSPTPLRSFVLLMFNFALSTVIVSFL